MIPGAHTDHIHTREALLHRVALVSDAEFDELALDIFRFQFNHNPLYREYVTLLGKSLHKVQETADIPFLPVSLFRQHDIRTNVWDPEVVFESSTTTGQSPGRHAVRDLQCYLQNTMRGFNAVIGRPVSDVVWLALLPSYVERPNSSLVHMVSHFIAQGQPGSRLISMEEAYDTLEAMDRGVAPVACIGVSFALLALAERNPLPLHNTLLIETGGMKGRGPEITRQALHTVLKEAFGLQSVSSEYGMTELLSQAWSSGEGMFRCAPTLRIVLRDLFDPMRMLGTGERGAICCIDLANLDSCAFIATDDIGLLHEDGAFEVLGRLDASELRGCNLMFEDGSTG